MNPGTIKSYKNVSFPAVPDVPAAGECEPQGRHCRRPYCPQKGVAFVLQYMTFWNGQNFCLKDEKTLLVESEQFIFNHRPQKGTATAVQPLQLNVRVEGCLNANVGLIY
jgi:hypothetical protein